MPVGVDQRLRVPEPDVVDGRLVGLERLSGEALLGRERLDGHVVQVIRLPRRRDAPLDIGALQLQFVGLDDQALNHRGEHLAEHESAPEDQPDRSQREPVAADLMLAQDKKAAPRASTIRIWRTGKATCTSA